MNAIKMFFVVSLCLAFIGQGHGAEAPHRPLEKSPIAVYVTWNAQPASSIVIHWVSASPERHARVTYARQGSAVKQSVKALSTPFPEGNPYYSHVASIEGLQEDSLYSFSISGYAVSHTFATMPKVLRRPITFVVGGDINLPDDPALFTETTRAMAEHAPDFVVLGGDLACAASRTKKKPEKCAKWIKWLSTWYKHSQQVKGRLFPLLVAQGNHEVKGYFGKSPAHAPFFRHLFPENPGYAAVRFGVGTTPYLSLYLLDSGHTHEVGGEQTSWLSKEMSKDASVPHRIAVYHVPAYPNVRSYRDAHSKAVRKFWVPVFDRCHLHMAFEHHEHAYKKTFPLTGDVRDPNGIVYIGNGSWGVKPRTPKRATGTAFLEKTASVRGFSLVKLSPWSREVSVYSYDNSLVDWFSQPTDLLIQKNRLEEEFKNWRKYFSLLGAVPACLVVSEG